MISIARDCANSALLPLLHREGRETILSVHTPTESVARIFVQARPTPQAASLAQLSADDILMGTDRGSTPVERSPTLPLAPNAVTMASFCWASVANGSVVGKPLRTLERLNARVKLVPTSTDEENAERLWISRADVTVSENVTVCAELESQISPLAWTRPATVIVAGI